MVERLSGGKVGYIHLPDTALEGNRMLQKLFYSQASKPALLIDDRYNGGGFIPDRMIEVLLADDARLVGAPRRREPCGRPGFAHDGPKAMLVNGYSSSGGDALPYFFREKKLGPLIGTRTWGGLIGLSGNPRLVDGGSARRPDLPDLRPRGELGRRERRRRPRHRGLRRRREAPRRGRSEPREGGRGPPRGPLEEARRRSRRPRSSSRRALSRAGTGPGAWRNTTPRDSTCREIASQR